MRLLLNTLLLLALSVCPAIAQQQPAPIQIVGNWSNITVVYETLDYKDRLKHPKVGQELRYVSIGVFNSSNTNLRGMTLRERFEIALKNMGFGFQTPDEFEMIQVVRILDPANPGEAVYWFEFIDTELLHPSEFVRR